MQLSNESIRFDGTPFGYFVRVFKEETRKSRNKYTLRIAVKFYKHRKLFFTLIYKREYTGILGVYKKYKECIFVLWRWDGTLQWQMVSRIHIIFHLTLRKEREKKTE